MNDALQIGPLSLPWPLLLVFAAIGLAQWVGLQLGHRAGIDAEPQLLRTLLLGLVVARLGSRSGVG